MKDPTGKLCLCSKPASKWKYHACCCDDCDGKEGRQYKWHGRQEIERERSGYLYRILFDNISNGVRINL